MTPSNFEDLTGCKFGRLTVVQRAKSAKGWRTRWLCRCDCGKEVIVDRGNLKSSHTKSCGCLSVEEIIKRSTTHGGSKEKLYYVWKAMINRCERDTVKVFPYYGGRGISVCTEWHDYEAFREWMLLNGYDPKAPRGKFTIDRIDADGDYRPDNCRVVSMKVQRMNQRRMAK